MLCAINNEEDETNDIEKKMMKNCNICGLVCVTEGSWQTIISYLKVHEYSKDPSSTQWMSNLVLSGVSWITYHQHTYAIHDENLFICSIM